MSIRRMTAGLVGVAMALALFSGCSTTGQQKPEQGASSMNTVKAEVEKADEQVTVAMQSLDKVMDPKAGDLRVLYEGFTAQVEILHAAAKAARYRALSIQLKNRDYLLAWEQQVSNIQDPAAKAQSLQEFNTAKASYLKVEQLLLKMGDSYRPLISSLDDLRTAMSQNMTAGGISALQPSYTKARQQAISLQGAMKETTKAIDEASKQAAPTESGVTQ
jgi:hypothetical protein